MSQEKERDDFDDPRVQAVYAILCDETPPPTGEHWEGFAARRIVAALATQPPAVQGEPVAFLANGTRFKMAFFDNADDLGNPTGGTHVTCFSNFAKELDGRWVALVAAEDDQHLRLQQSAVASTPSREVEPLTEDQIWQVLYPYSLQAFDSPGGRIAVARAIEAAHGIHSRGEGEKA